MSVHAHARKVKLGKTAVLGVMRYMLNQFQMLNLDVSRFSDEAIAAAQAGPLEPRQVQAIAESFRALYEMA